MNELWKKVPYFPNAAPLTHYRLLGWGGRVEERILRRNLQMLPLSWVGEDLERWLALALGKRWGGGGDCWWWSLTGLPMWFWHSPKDLIFYQCLQISFIVWYILVSSWSKVVAPYSSGHSFFPSILNEYKDHICLAQHEFSKFSSESCGRYSEHSYCGWWEWQLALALGKKLYPRQLRKSCYYDLEGKTIMG